MNETRTRIIAAPLLGLNCMILTVHASTPPATAISANASHVQSLADASIFKAIWTMPEGIGALIGSFGGLLAVAVSGVLAFWLTRRADKRRKDLEARTLATALQAELQVLSANLSHWTDRLRSLAESETASVMLLSRLSETPVFNANVGRIGILGSSLTYDLVRVCGTFQLWKQLMQTGEETEIARFSKEVKSKPEAIEKLVPRVAELAWRLEEFAKDGKDPGPAKGSSS